MNQLEFKFIEAQTGSGTYYYDSDRVEIYVDGKGLSKWILENEKKFFKRDDDREFGYVGPYWLFNELKREFMEEGGPTLLGCGCGEEGCAPLVFDMKEDESTIKFKPLRMPFEEDSDYSQFPEFIFSQENYQEEFNKLKQFLAERSSKIGAEDEITTQDCPTCGQFKKYSTLYDSYYCTPCNKWLEDDCGDPECMHCKYREDKPFNRGTSKYKLLCHMAEGNAVYVEKGSHAQTHLQDTPELKALLKEALVDFLPTKERESFQIDMGRVIGESDMALLEEGGEVFYAKRKNRTKYTKFVKNKEPYPTQFLTGSLRKRKNKSYVFITAFVGKTAPDFPYGPEDTNKKSRKFWENRALVFGKQEIDESTITTICPW